MENEMGVYQDKLQKNFDRINDLPDLPEEVRKQLAKLPDFAPSITPYKPKPKFNPSKVPEEFTVRVETFMEKRVSARIGGYQEITTVIRNGKITSLPTISEDMINNAPEDWLVYAKSIVDAMTEGRILNKMDPNI